MKRVVFVIIAAGLFFLPRLVSAQSSEFPVELQRTLKNSPGTLIITPEQIEFKATKPKDSKKSRTWRYVDIRQIKVESPKAIEIVTYEDQKRMLGRDRIFKFRLLSGEITPEISALLMTKATRPVVTSLIPATTDSPTFELPVKHLHTWGGCEGVVKIYPDRVTYESKDMPSDSRYWRYADIERFGHPTRYRFEITTFEDKLGGPTKTYNFQLKEEFPAGAYDYVWLRVYPREQGAWSVEHGSTLGSLLPAPCALLLAPLLPRSSAPSLRGLPCSPAPVVRYWFSDWLCGLLYLNCEEQGSCL